MSPNLKIFCFVIKLEVGKVESKFQCIASNTAFPSILHAARKCISIPSLQPYVETILFYLDICVLAHGSVRVVKVVYIVL